MVIEGDEKVAVAPTFTGWLAEVYPIADALMLALPNLTPVI